MLGLNAQRTMLIISGTSGTDISGHKALGLQGSVNEIRYEFAYSKAAKH